MVKKVLMLRGSLESAQRHCAFEFYEKKKHCRFERLDRSGGPAGKKRDTTRSKRSARSTKSGSGKKGEDSPQASYSRAASQVWLP